MIAVESMIVERQGLPSSWLWQVVFGMRNNFCAAERVIPFQRFYQTEIVESMQVPSTL
jgi:hypothetical protein